MIKVKLIVIGGKKNGLEIPISTPIFRIGRGNRCHIRPQNSLVADLHCQISTGSESVILEDYGANIGTFVNGERVQKQRKLQDKDRIKIASLEFSIRLDKDEPVEEDFDIFDFVQQDEKARNLPPKAVMPREMKPKAVAAKRLVLPIVPAVPPASTAPPAAEVPMPLPIASSSASDAARVALKMKRPKAAPKDAAWEVTDVWLVLTIIPLVGVLLSFLPTFWIWRSLGGIVLTTSALVFRKHLKRSGGFRLDELNVAAMALTVLVVSLMTPQSWVWTGLSVGLLIALGLAVANRWLASSKWDDTNIALLASMSLVLYMLGNWFPFRVNWQAVGGVLVLAALGLAIGLRIKRKAGGEFDNMKSAIVTAIVMVAYIAAKPLCVMPHAQLCGAVILLLVMTIAFGLRAKYNKLDALNLALLIEIGFLEILSLQLMLPTKKILQGGSLFLLAVYIPLFGIYMIRSKMADRWSVLTVASLLQIVLLAVFVANVWLPLRFQPSMLWAAAVWGSNQPKAVVLEPIRLQRNNKLLIAKQGGNPVQPAAPVAKAMPNKPLPAATPRKESAKVENVPLNKKPLGQPSPNWPSVAKGIPTPEKPAIQWVAVSWNSFLLVTLVALFGVRVRRLTKSRLDGLNLLLLMMAASIAVSLVQLASPGVCVWNWAVVGFLVVFVPLLIICLLGVKAEKLDEVNLAIFMQIGVLVVFLANIWLPYYRMRDVVFMVLAITFLFAFKICRRWIQGKGEAWFSLAMLVQLGIFGSLVVGQSLPSLWTKIGEGVIFAFAMATVPWLYQKRNSANATDALMLRFMAIGIAVIVLFGFLFPITSWWPT